MHSTKLEKELQPVIKKGKPVEVKMYISMEKIEGTPFACHASVGDSYTVYALGETPQEAVASAMERFVKDMPTDVERLVDQC